MKYCTVDSKKHYMAVCKHLIYGIDLCSFLHQEGHGDRVHILLVNADENEMHFFKQAFAKQYKWITIKVGNVHSYLGVQVSFKLRCMETDMWFYVKQVLANNGKLLMYKIPATKDLFVVHKKHYLIEE
jgi:hypothetical protein